MDYNGFVPPYMNNDTNFDYHPCDNDMFNPINQYEQAYMYYRYMAQMMDYKIKCKEYEKLCSKQGNSTNNKTS